MAKEKKKTPLDKKSPLPLQSTLVRQAGLTSKYGTGYEGYGEVDVDKMMDPMKEALGLKMKKKEKSDKGSKGSGVGPAGPAGAKGDKGDKGDPGGTADPSETTPGTETPGETPGADEETGCDQECCDEKAASGENVTWSTANSDEGECVKSITEKETGHPQCKGGTWNRDTNQCECPDGTKYDEETFTCVEDVEDPGTPTEKGTDTEGTDDETSGDFAEDKCPECPDGTVPERVNGKCDCPEDTKEVVEEIKIDDSVSERNEKLKKLKLQILT